MKFLSRESSWAQCCSALRSSSCLLVLAFSFTAAFAESSIEASQSDDNPPQTLSRMFVDNGVSVKFEVMSMGTNGIQQGEDVRVRFSVQDQLSSEPVRGLHPLGWIDPRQGEAVPSIPEARDRIAAYMGGVLSIEPDIDLTSYRVWTINHDASVSVINPLVNFSRTKLESLIPLEGIASDLVFSPDQEFLYVSIPKESNITVMDTATRKIVKTIALRPGSTPRRLLMQPDGEALWVGLDQSSSVAVISTEDWKQIAEVEVGEGLHLLSWIPEDDIVAITSSSAGTVTLVEASNMNVIASLDVGETPIALDYGQASGLLYVASANGSGIYGIDPVAGTIVHRMDAVAGITFLTFEPSGRYGFAVNQIRDEILIFDTATRQLTQTIEAIAGPDQIQFSEEYAYIRGVNTSSVMMLELKGLERGKVIPVEIIAGKEAANVRPEEINSAPMIAPTPEGNSVMIANSSDMRIYYYVEGMLAPMGSFQNYKRRPLGLAIMDKSLLEVAPGVYETTVTLPSAGVQDVYFVIDQPRVVKVLGFEVAPKESTGPEQLASIEVELLDLDAVRAVGRPTKLQFPIYEKDSNRTIDNLEDVQVMVMRDTATWHQRQWAKNQGQGVYEINPVFPEPGMYTIVLWIESRGITYDNSPVFKIHVHNTKNDGGQG